MSKTALLRTVTVIGNSCPRGGLDGTCSETISRSADWMVRGAEAAGFIVP